MSAPPANPGTGCRPAKIASLCRGDCFSRCRAYRSGLRRALAETTRMRVYAEQRRAEMVGRRMDDSRRGKVTSLKSACSRINELMTEPCPFRQIEELNA